MFYNLRVICGYGGAGKSTLVSKMKDEQFIDLDSGYFTKGENFPRNYLDALLQLDQVSKKGTYVFISTHKALLEQLNANDAHYALVSPDSQVSAEQWEKRYLDRPNPEGYIEFMRAHYDEFVRDMEAHATVNQKKSHCLFIRLGEDEYLIDKFSIIKQWFDAVQAQ